MHAMQNHWAAMAVVFLAAGFGGPAVQVESGSQCDTVVDSAQPEQSASAVATPIADEMVFGLMRGDLTANAQPLEVEVRIIARDGQRGNSIVGIALAKSEQSRGPGWGALPAWAHAWILADSALEEQVMLRRPGDHASFDVNFLNGGGYIRYEISVASADPAVFAIAISGELRGELATPELPLLRTLNLCWGRDGLLTGDAIVRGTLSTGESYSVAAVISGEYYAANPGVLPTKVSGKLAVTWSDLQTGRWAGLGSRTIAHDLDGDGVIDEE